jgi:hypothetical protein
MVNAFSFSNVFQEYFIKNMRDEFKVREEMSMTEKMREMESALESEMSAPNSTGRNIFCQPPSWDYITIPCPQNPLSSFRQWP